MWQSAQGPQGSTDTHSSGSAAVDRQSRTGPGRTIGAGMRTRPRVVVRIRAAAGVGRLVVVGVEVREAAAVVEIDVLETAGPAGAGAP